MSETRANLPDFIQLTDKQRLEFWRYEYLTVYARLPHRDASDLAATALDLHEIERLVKLGCDVPRVKKILE